MSNLIDLDGLDLGSLDEKGKPVETRLKDVSSAVGLFATLLKADEKSAVNRARIDSMFDGAAPYSQSQLTASGQGLKTNLNFGEAQRLLDISLSAYVDLYSSLERLVEVRATSGERSEQGPKEDVVAEELTNLFRRWPEFHSSYLRLCTQFIKHGVGIAYFDSPDDWKFRVGGFADILIPRQSPASENGIDIAIGRRQYHLHELYHFIKNEKVAKSVGWNVEEVKRVMLDNVKTSGRSHQSGATYSDYEALQAEIKNNDLYTGIQNPTVDVLHYWVREMDGSVSHYISAETSPKDFIYKKVSRYASPEQAYIFFSYGVGSNGTYHSVRGLGQRIFSHVQTSNRLRCQQIDGAMLGSSVMIQPENQRSLDELQFTFYGAYAVLSPNVRIIEKAIPNLGTAVQPALQDLAQQLSLNTDTVSTYGSNQGSPYRNQMQVVADMDVATRISGSTLNLFYASWTRLMREMVRRVIQTKRPDAAVKDFFARCERRGISADFIKKFDVEQTKAVRSIGNGSHANRLVALRELQGISGQFDDVGRRNLTRDIVSTRVGHDLADRYVPAQDSQRQTVDTKIAYLENMQLQQGNPVPVVSSELHGQHLQLHVPLLQQIIQALDEGQADPQQALPAVQALYQHISETAQYASGDPALQDTVAQTKQVLQYAEEAINNTMKALQKMQRDQAENPQEGTGQPQVSEIDLKLQKAQVDMQIAQQKAELDMAIKQRKFDQDQAIRDAEAALRFRQQE
jgi:ribosome-associated translation inhibitor RaiA